MITKIVVHGAEDCPRCSLGRFNWLECTCGLFCRQAINCNGLKREEVMIEFTDASAAYERSHGTDPDRWDAAGEYERLREEGMTQDQANEFIRVGEASKAALLVHDAHWQGYLSASSLNVKGWGGPGTPVIDWPEESS